MVRIGVPAAVILVGVLAAGCGSTDGGSPAFLERYSKTIDPRVIVVYFTTGACDKVGTPTTRESNEAVQITVLVAPAPPDQECSTLAPVTREARVSLRRDLGSRRVRGRDRDPDLPEVPPSSS